MSAKTMVAEHRSQLLQLRGLATADVARLLAEVIREPVADVRNALIEVLPDLLAPYRTASGELAAVLYEDLRADASVRGTFYAESAAPELDVQRVRSTAGWAVDPLVPVASTIDALDERGYPVLSRVMSEPNEAAVLSRLAGSVSRMVMEPSRETMQLNGARESVRFQRMARPGACAFCGMLASRPPWMAYRSSESAGGVVGRGSEHTGFDAADNRLSGGIGGGIVARGKADLGDSYHDDCRCVVMPLHPGSEMSELARLDRESWEQKYVEALPKDRAAGMSIAEMDAAIKRGENPIEARDIQAVLANWRKVHGTR